MDARTLFNILWNYFFYFITLIITFYVVYRLLKLFIKKEHIFKGGYQHDYIKNLKINYQKAYNIASIIFSIILIVIVSYGSSFMLPDFFNVVNNNYTETSCVVKSVSREDEKYHSRYLKCEDENKNIISFAYYGVELEKNSKIKVRYFKHIKIGMVVGIYEQN